MLCDVVLLLAGVVVDVHRALWLWLWLWLPLFLRYAYARRRLEVGSFMS